MRFFPLPKSSPFLRRKENLARNEGGSPDPKEKEPAKFPFQNPKRVRMYLHILIVKLD